MKRLKRFFKSEFFKRSMAVFGCMLLLFCTVSMPAAAETITGVDEVDEMLTRTGSMFYGTLSFVGGIVFAIGIILFIINALGGPQLMEKLNALSMALVGIVMIAIQFVVNWVSTGISH